MTDELEMNEPIRFGKYLLHEIVGRGGFGTIYRAEDTALNVQRAIKVLHPALNADPIFIERFRLEARMAARLDHPHVVPVIDLGQSAGSYYLVMRFMVGGSLKDLLKKDGALPLDRSLEILSQIADGLDFIHGQPEKIIHRDIKPGNILFESDGTGRISDLGFAKALEGAGSVSLSATGGMTGTPAYMAPEIWRGQTVSPATDIYSLSCVFYEMLTGDVLFQGNSPAEVMTRHVLDGPAVEQSWPEDLHDGLQVVLKKALAVDPAERFSSGADLVEAVRGALAPPPPEREAAGDVTGEETRPAAPRHAAPRPGEISPAHTPEKPEPVRAEEPAADESAGPAEPVRPPPPPPRKMPEAPEPAGPGPSSGRRRWFAGLGVIVVLCSCVLFADDLWSAVFVDAEPTEPAQTLAPTEVAGITRTLTPTKTAARTPTSTPSRTPTPTPSPTRTLTPVEETFGRDGIANSTCTVNDPTTSVTQAELFDDKWMYFTLPVTQQDLGDSLLWSVQGPEDEVVYSQNDRTIEEEHIENSCIWQGFAISAFDSPGVYILEVVDPDGFLSVYNFEVIESVIPTPVDQPPLGDFTFGRDGIDDGCIVDIQTDEISAADLDEDPWIYFASTYSTDEVGNELTYRILGPNGDVFAEGTRTLELKVDLCFWQGRSLGGSDAETGFYRVEVDYLGSTLDVAVFEVRP